MKITWLSRKQLDRAARAQIQDTAVVLDIGCGINPQTYSRALVHICCEPFGQYVAKLQQIIARKKMQNRMVVVQADWAQAVKIFPARSIDTIYLIDVIEHLPKKEAVGLLKKTLKIARRQVVIFTPLGFAPQNHPDGKDAWGMDGGKMQEHRSGWLPADFDDSWQILATKKYHLASHSGHLSDKYGAFYAIKNISVAQNEKRSGFKDLVDNFKDFGLKVNRKIRKIIL